MVSPKQWEIGHGGIRIGADHSAPDRIQSGKNKNLC